MALFLSLVLTGDGDAGRKPLTLSTALCFPVPPYGVCLSNRSLADLRADVDGHLGEILVFLCHKIHQMRLSQMRFQ